MVFIVGRRYKKQASDTVKAFRHIPLLRYDSWEQYFSNPVYSWEHIGIEILDGAEQLPLFKHPKSCVYLFGPEDGSLDPYARKRCRRLVSIPSRRCLNLAVAASVVMYDRIAKRGENAD